MAAVHEEEALDYEGFVSEDDGLWASTTPSRHEASKVSHLSTKALKAINSLDGDSPLRKWEVTQLPLYLLVRV